MHQRLSNILVATATSLLALASAPCAAQGASPTDRCVRNGMPCTSTANTSTREAPAAASSVPTVQTLLIVDPPPRSLADGAEVMMITGYQPSMAQQNVNIDRPGKSLVLVLSSYARASWRVSATPGTRLLGILVSSYERSTLDAPMHVRGYAVSLPYATEIDSRKLRHAIRQLNALFGITRIDAFRGSYDIPSVTDIREVDARRPELTLAGLQATAPASPFEFDLVGLDGQKVRWTNGGPRVAADGTRDVLHQGKSIVLPSGTTVRLGPKGLDVLEPGKAPSLRALPASLPEFSWAMDVAYDSHQGIVAVVSLGGEGFFYRYDLTRDQWLDARSMNNEDVTSLAYDAGARRYLGWTSYGQLLSIRPDGTLEGSAPLAKLLPGLGSIYDRGNQPVPRVGIAAHKGQVALVAFEKSAIGRSPSATVDIIWTYDPKSGAASMTYKAPVRAAAQR
jgi:hypothetical protein